MPSGLVDSKHNLPAVNIELIGDEGYPVLPGCIAAAALLLLVLVLGGELHAVVLEQGVSGEEGRERNRGMRLEVVSGQWRSSKAKLSFWEQD